MFGGYNASVPTIHAPGAFFNFSYYADTFILDPEPEDGSAPYWRQVITRGWPTYRAQAKLFTDPETYASFLLPKNAQTLSNLNQWQALPLRRLHQPGVHQGSSQRHDTELRRPVAAQDRHSRRLLRRRRSRRRDQDGQGRALAAVLRLRKRRPRRWPEKMFRFVRTTFHR